MPIREPHSSLIPLPVPMPPEMRSPPPSAALSEPGVLEGDAGLDWRRVLGAVTRFRWLILAATALATGLGVVATRFVKPQYVAQATIWIDESERRTAADRGPIRGTQLLDPEAWVDLLRSYEVLDRVVREQRLYLTVRPALDSTVLSGFTVADDYRAGKYRLTTDSSGRRYTLATADGVELDRGVVGDSVGRRLGFLWAPTPEALGAGRTVQFAVAAVRDGARLLSDELDVHTDPMGNLLRLELRGASPTRITAIVNAVTQRYVAVAADLKRQKVSELTKILDQQLETARENLRQAEVALERFGVRTITLPSGRAGAPAPSAAAGGDAVPSDPAVAGFFDLQLEHDQLQRDRAALEQAVARPDSGVSASLLEAIPAVKQSPDLVAALKELVNKQADLRTLRYHYTDEYPDVQRLSADIAVLERRTIPALARGLANELGAREAELGRRVDAGSHTLRQIPPRTMEEARLRRAAMLAETVYTTLQQRYAEARLAEASATPDVRILDSALVPQRPVKNTAPRIVLLACVAGFGLAVLGAVLLDRVDPRVRYPDQVSREMGLPILGAIPHLRKGDLAGRGGPPSESVAEVVEALRGVCLNVMHAYGAGPMVLTLTSPGPGDGKSFLAANLARTFAEGGQRTLLVDADIRRGVLHRRLGGVRRPGLSDFLRGEADLDGIVQTTAHPSLALVGCGTRVHHAPELLGSPAMGQALARLRSAYGVVVVDTPPLAAGVDPLILATLTGNLVMVLRTGYSDREMATAKLEVVHRLPVRLLGAVLNDVPDGAAYRYYSYYLPGYEAADEDARGEAVVIP
jgi:succinoglycan biosynthesis transport protein ExoP